MNVIKLHTGGHGIRDQYLHQMSGTKQMAAQSSAEGKVQQFGWGIPSQPVINLGTRTAHPAP